ncbi:MAG: hypothetical protein IJZ42_07180 [Lachnospiraceae bacterium]|nr:hypothetical protein [Lachnospiraceae bacterium]
MSNNQNIPVELLGLSVRSYNCLKRNKINTLGELMKLSADEIKAIKNLGQKSAAEVFEVIAQNASGKLQPTLDLLEETYASITENPFRFRKDGNIIKAGKKKVLHYVEDMTVTQEVQDVFFYDVNDILVDDINVQDMPLSVRAKGALLRKGYFTAKTIVDLDYSDFCAIKNMGSSTRDEILQVLMEKIFVQYKTGLNSTLIETYADMINEDIKVNCPKMKPALYVSQVKVAVHKNKELLDKSIENIFEYKEFINRIYSEPALYKVFENYICQLLLDYVTLSLYALKQKMPVGLRSSDVFMEIINKLTARGKIEYTESGLQYHLMTVLDYTKLLEEGNQKTALMCRLKGMTLEETGGIIGVTRERARQLAKTALAKMPKLREDDFKYWYENYDVTKEEFRNIFNLTEESYNYLKGTYKKGTKTLEELLNDQKITGPIAQRATKEMYKYCVVIEGEYVPLKREALVRKLFEINYSNIDCVVSEFYHLYLEFLNNNGLNTNEKLLYPSERAFEARMGDQRYVLLKYGRRVRYYNMDEYDLDELFSKLDLIAYEGLEISTLKLFNTYPELMDEYNIMDEYELHNLMKKNEEKLQPFKITLGRMPFLSIGESDREQQTIDFLYQVAPIEFYDFGKAFEEEFGIKSETALANFTTFIKKYYDNGMFSVDYVVMSDEEYEILNKKLPEDFYFIEDIRKVYVQEFPAGDIEKINPYNLKTMGFLVYVDYVVRDTYNSCEAYFRELLLRNDITDISKFDKRIVYNQVFQFVVESLRVDFSLLEFERNKYVTFERFSKGAPDVTKEDLRKYAFDAANYCSEEFFSIKSIRNKGFTSNLDGLGFDDWFYGALLRANKEIRYSKTGGGFLFSHMGRQFSRSDFFLFLMKKFKKIDIIKFIEYIKDEYGLKFDRYDVTPIISKSSMYYDSIMEKIYLNKEEYYEDI